MPSQYSDPAKERALQTLESIEDTILITAIGEGVNRINRVLPDFLTLNFPTIPWHAIIGMRNHLAHGYFELDSDLVFEAVKNDIPCLITSIQEAISLLKSDK